MRRSAFTLIELIFVIVILGILSAVALPRFGNMSDNATKVKEISDVSSIKTAIQNVRALAILDTNDSGFVNIDDIDIKVDTTKNYPLDLSIPDDVGSYTNGEDANFSTILSDSPGDWKFTSTDNQYKSPLGNIYTYDSSNGKFSCSDGDDSECP